jgi:hypothetical protein
MYKKGVEMILVAKPEIKKTDYKSLENEFLKIMAKGRFFKSIEQGTRSISRISIIS